MLTDRLDVPHTLLWRFKPPNVFFWGQTQERAYNLNDNVSRDLYSTFVHKNNFLFRIEVTFNLYMSIQEHLMTF